MESRRRRSRLRHGLAVACAIASLLVACDAPLEIVLPPVVDAQVTARPPAPVSFRPADFLPPHEHQLPADVDDMAWAYYQQAGGLAVGDFDGDGREDLFASGGESGHRLFKNLGGGVFEVTVARLPLVDGFVSSATFADVDGDGDPDLLLSHLLGARGLTLLRNDDGQFVDASRAAGLGDFAPPASWSTTFADIDGDSDLDFFVAQWLHWTTPEPRPSPHVFCNDGTGHFQPCLDDAGLADHFATRVDASFTATFADLDEDGASDLLLASDYRRSHVFRGDGGRFRSLPVAAALMVEFGMGSVVEDFDGDLHLDWFVTAIDLPTELFNTSGNRLMLGDGRGGLRDVTDGSGVMSGGWGWAACAADFDLDGDVDIFHVNGYEARPSVGLFDFTRTDRSRLFRNDGAAHFDDIAAAVGMDDPDHLTATVCADLDDDGDVDIITLAVGGPLRAYENTLGGGLHFIALDLEGIQANSQAIGARVLVRSGDHQQVAERRIDNTHTSGQSVRLHFGLPDSSDVTVEVRWPDGRRSVRHGLAPDQHHWLRHPSLGWPHREP